ncbi:hypothetical protein Ppa06_65640 [Planomonospora parontospora subsp. parontospora]|uniref:Uncharacterized protein n=2 Tax=Planomonospora parontospora TaxID=58119 RepID=A0AA37BNA6_9ACTN|nr:hypothetical protein [Planomonospora parontospora]GGK96494.1 hypothetical protein GCM10010126_64900 [Planomonospora parontospora]GII12766.1 hypothetical protein Ppa06_65640 [Planomonospora parontospora subsp. parontospora]
MYANSALALTGAGMSVAGSVALPPLHSGSSADAALSPAADVARTLLMITGAGFGLFLLAMAVLLAAGAVLRGVDAARRRRALPRADRRARHTAAGAEGRNQVAELLR